MRNFAFTHQDPIRSEICQQSLKQTDFTTNINQIYSIPP